jgi:hypothetical protein
MGNGTEDPEYWEQRANIIRFNRERIFQFLVVQALAFIMASVCNPKFLQTEQALIWDELRTKWLRDFYPKHHDGEV